MKLTNSDKNMATVILAKAGEHKAVKGPGPAKKKPYLSTIIFGTISLTAYLLLFKNEQWVTEAYTMGGWHAIFPIGTALLFSFVHGTFGGSLLSVLGLEAKKKNK
jgi:uncharacterized integral membrane protein